jgi:hypothetical protein
MSSKLVAIQIANVAANARSERRDVHRKRHPKPARTTAVRRVVAVPETSWTVPARRVRPIRSVVGAAAQAIARLRGAVSSAPGEAEVSPVAAK